MSGTMMKAVRAHDFGGPEQLRYEDVEKPVAGPGQLVVQVKAASVNPVDWKLRSGAAKAIVNFPMPMTSGGDLAGVVEALGDGVEGWHIGDEVYAQIGLTGANAEYVAIPAEHVAKKPANLDFIEAASLPLVALTALQGFDEDGRDLAGLTVLVHNAAGGVGSVAVQIAKAKGATVIGTASQANADFVRGLGADEAVDFRVTPVAGRTRDVDILLDMVGDPDALQLWSLVKPGGSVIRIAGGADAPAFAEADGIRAIKTRVRPSGERLAQVTELVEAGQLRTEIAKVFPLAQAGEAQELSRAGHVRGKIVLSV